MSCREYRPLSYRPGLQFRPRRPDGVSRGRQGAAGRILCLRRRRCVLPLWTAYRNATRGPGGAADGGIGRHPCACARGDRVQYRLDPGAGTFAAAPHRALRRHGPGHQAGLHGVAVAAGFRARNRGHRAARIHPHADSVISARAATSPWWGPPTWRRWRRHRCTVERPTMMPSPARSRRVSSKAAAAAPIRSCWPARIIRYCCSGCSALPPGRSTGSIRHLRSRAGLPVCSGRRLRRVHKSKQLHFLRRASSLHPRWWRLLRDLGLPGWFRTRMRKTDLRYRRANVNARNRHGHDEPPMLQVVGPIRDGFCRPAPYSSLSLCFTTTSRHIRVSRAIRAVNEAGVEPSTATMSCAASFSRNAGSAKIAVTAAARRSTTGFGVPAGARMPYQLSVTKSGTPASITVGVSGSSAERSTLGTASARTAPDWISAIAEDTEENPTGTWPATMSCICGAAPL